MATKQERAEALKKDWATNPRWKDVKRDYTAEEVINISGSVPVKSFSRNVSGSIFISSELCSYGGETYQQLFDAS